LGIIILDVIETSPYVKKIESKLLVRFSYLFSFSFLLANLNFFMTRTVVSKLNDLKFHTFFVRGKEITRQLHEQYVFKKSTKVLSNIHASYEPHRGEK